MELYIKNMVCDRCIKVVKEELEGFDLHPVSVELGIVKLTEESLNPEKLSSLNSVFKKLGFELLDNTKAQLVEQIKNLIINRIYHFADVDGKVNWSRLIAEQCSHEYNYLSALFSSMEGVTIEQYIIRQKIERVKELLFYNELSLGEIANQLGYSSIAHLSSQFKKTTGQTPSAFKKSRSSRKAIDKI
jgi:AraC family transcriptional regulator